MGFNFWTWTTNQLLDWFIIVPKYAWCNRKCLPRVPIHSALLAQCLLWTSKFELVGFLHGDNPSFPSFFDGSQTYVHSIKKKKIYFPSVVSVFIWHPESESLLSRADVPVMEDGRKQNERTKLCTSAFTVDWLSLKWSRQHLDQLRDIQTATLHCCWIKVTVISPFAEGFRFTPAVMPKQNPLGSVLISR